MDESDAPSWIKLAENDLNSAQYLLGLLPRPVEVICFLCQQSAEKILKALLAHDGIEIPRTHDLAALTQSMQISRPELGGILGSCVRLSLYAVTTRYPYPGTLPHHAETTAIDDAISIMKALKKILRA